MGSVLRRKRKRHNNTPTNKFGSMGEIPYEVQEAWVYIGMMNNGRAFGKATIDKIQETIAKYPQYFKQDK